MITAAAIRLGKGEVDWQAAVELAAWDRQSREVCEEASGPDDEELRATALSMLANGGCDDWRHEKLAVRCNLVLTDAAAKLIAAEAARMIKEAEERAFQNDVALRNRKNEARDAILAALGERCDVVTDGYGGFGSIYLRYRAKSGHHVSIRISDHQQVPGGGWCEATGERHGESDVCFLIDSPDAELPSRSEVRSEVAAALLAMRRW